MSLRHPTPQTTLVRAVAAIVAVGGLAVVPPASADTARTETPVVSSSPITSVTESLVTIADPLPASDGARPAACDRLSYLRWRDAAGPAESAQADRILLAQPGIFEGAGAFDSVARNTVAAAAAQGEHIEFWALDRRSNCLEDHTGEQAALKAGDPHIAIDYYYRSKQVDGQTFAGFDKTSQDGFLGNVGMAQTVQDEYDLITHELPDPAVRQSKLFCGGHSLGGIITGYFAEWDFAGTAGADQCAGWFALDSVVSTQAPIPGLGSMVSDASAGDPVLELPAVINPETMSLLGLSGLYARLDPTSTSDLLSYLPVDSNVDITLRLLFSQDWAHFISGTPSIRDFHFTNQAALGALLDNNSMPLGFLETSVGFATGGPIGNKDFPVPNDWLNIPGFEFLGKLVGTDPKAIPTDPSAHYDWLDYDQVTANSYTSPDKEVSDIHELARSLSEAPLDFTEWYFPAKLAFDSLTPGTDVTSHVTHTDGIERHPTLQVTAGSGVGLGSGTPPANTTQVIAPYYHHLDVLTAAPAQNNGKPETVSTNLLTFVLSH